MMTADQQLEFISNLLDELNGYFDTLDQDLDRLFRAHTAKLIFALEDIELDLLAGDRVIEVATPKEFLEHEFLPAELAAFSAAIPCVSAILV